MGVGMLAPPLVQQSAVYVTQVLALTSNTGEEMRRRRTWKES